MERIKSLGRNWKKWALTGAVAAAAIAGWYRMTRQAGPESPAQSQAEDPPRRYDHIYKMVSQHRGINVAEMDLEERQQQYQRKTDLRAQNNDKAAGEVD